MNTEQTLAIRSTDLNNTLQIAAAIGKRLKGSEVIELIGDLGSGKTAFTRGLVGGFGSSAAVSSPTYTLSNIYEHDESELSIHHFDFYRLDSAGIDIHALSDVAGKPDIITVVEWVKDLKDALPSDKVAINLVADSEDTRRIDITYSKKYAYLFEDLQP